MRIDPIRSAAIIACMSPTVWYGNRVFVWMSSTTSVSTPSAMSRTGPILKPSWKMSVESIDAPTSLPPMSIQCALVAEKPTSTPSTNTGAKIVTSLRCVPPM